MRLLHSADWHLGRLFHGVSLIEDQAHLLDGFARLAAEAKVDAILLAGDLYDRAVPPPEAVTLFDDFLARVAGELGLPTIVIAGNHDSADRLAFGSRLMSRGGLHVRGRLEPDPAPVVLEDAHGPVEIHALPFVDPPHARAVLADCGDERTAEEGALRDHDACNAAFLDRMRAGASAGRRRVCVAHAFVAGRRGDAASYVEGGDVEEGDVEGGEVEETESERPLVVGGGGQVDAGHFEGFDYVALGHLHRPQALSGGRIRYSGSLMPYSFGESLHEKSVSVVDLDADGGVSVEAVSLSPRRAVKIMEGTLEGLLDATPEGVDRDDYLLARLTDDGALFHPMARLRERYPNVLQIERPALALASGPGAAAASTRTKRAPEQLFEDFFEAVEGREMEPEELDLLREIVRGDPARTEPVSSNAEGGA